MRLPRRFPDALRAIGARLAFALLLVVLVAAAVYAGRGGYRDGNGDGVSLLDAVYYTVATLTFTAHGDIAPVSEPARLVSILLVTPARVLFLIVLVGTTLEVLSEQYRNNVRLMRWRKRVKDHVIVCGYGTKGRSAVNALLEDGIAKDRILVVEKDPVAVRQAAAAGFAAIEGSATRAAVLTEAYVARAKAVIVAAHSDEAAVLITLTARQLTNGQVRIIAAAREAENAPLLKQSGAHHVVVSSATAGRLLGMSTTAPPIIDVVEDLLTPGEGMVLAVRSVTRDELGVSPRELADVVIAVVRRGRILQVGPEAGSLANGDSIVYVRSAQPVAAPADQ